MDTRVHIIRWNPSATPIDQVPDHLKTIYSERFPAIQARSSQSLTPYLNEWRHTLIGFTDPRMCRSILDNVGSATAGALLVADEIGMEEMMDVADILAMPVVIVINTYCDVADRVHVNEVHHWPLNDTDDADEDLP